MLLPDTELPTTLKRRDGSRFPGTDSEEMREACRALKGADPPPGNLCPRRHRREPTGPTASPSATTPSSCSSRRASNRHAVFFTHARETIDFHYERKLVDVAGKQARRSARDPRHDAGGRRLRQCPASPSRSATAGGRA